MSDVTIKLTGSEYRTLCSELEYHAAALKDNWKEIDVGAAREAAMKRLAVFQDVREKVAA